MRNLLALAPPGAAIVAARSEVKSASVTVIDLPQRRPIAPASMAPAGFGVTLYDGASLAAANWPSIDAPADLRMYVYQSREFLATWRDTIGCANGIRCLLVVVRDGEQRPVLYLPLAIETKFKTRLLRFMDFGVADYNAPILRAGCALSRQQFDGIWSQILALLPGVDVIDLKKMPSEVCGLFNPLTYLDCAFYAESGHAMLLHGLRGEIDSRHAVVNQRRQLARAWRRLQDCGEPRFVASPSGPALEQVTERLLELKRRKFRQTNVPDFLACPGVTEFYRAMTAPDRLGRIGHMSALMLGGDVAAAHLGFVGRGRFYYTVPAYDTAYGRYRVGHLLLAHLIDHAIEDDFETFDLGVGDFSYKYTWATDHLPLYTHERALTAAGSLYLQLRRAQRLIKSGTVAQWLRRAR